MYLTNDHGCCEPAHPALWGSGGFTASWGEPALETLRLKQILQQQMCGLALHSCEKVREKLSYAKCTDGFLLPGCWWAPSPSTQLPLLVLISSFLERKNICDKGKWNIPLARAHCVLISCLECHRGNIPGPFHFLSGNLCFPTQKFSVHTSCCSTNTSAASAAAILCKWLCIHFFLFINKEDKNELKVFFYSDPEFSLSCLETGSDWQDFPADVSEQGGQNRPKFCSGALDRDKWCPTKHRESACQSCLCVGMKW